MATKEYTSITNKYQTPKTIYRPILDFCGVKKFNIDVCCDDVNIPALEHFTFDGASRNWLIRWLPTTDHLINFMNPPFDKTKIWLEKAFHEVLKNNNCEVWCVLPGDRLNNNYFTKRLNANSNWFIAALRGRVNFINPALTDEENRINDKNGGYNKPIFIMYIGKNAAEYAQRWHREQPIKSIVMKGVFG